MWYLNETTLGLILIPPVPMFVGVGLASAVKLLFSADISKVLVLEDIAVESVNFSSHKQS